MPTAQREMFTVRQVAKMLALSEKALRGRLDRGEMKPLYLGKTIRFTAAQVDDLFTYGTTPPPQLAEAVVAGATN